MAPAEDFSRRAGSPDESTGSLRCTSALGTALLAYIRFIEEKELDARFGQDYVNYKRTTPFLRRARRTAGEHRS